jgi:hypothetical protein
MLAAAGTSVDFVRVDSNRMAVLQAVPGKTQTTASRELAFALGFCALLILAQTAYAYAYLHLRVLRASAILQIAFRLITWTFPVVVHLMDSPKGVLDFLKLRSGKLSGVTWGCAVGIVLVAVNLLAAYLMKGQVRINFHLGGAIWWKAIALVGLSEEVVFRGYLLREFAGRARFWKANLAQTALFLIIHFPGWILSGQFHFPAILHMGGYILGAGLFLGMMWKKTNSLWTCMLIHSASNFCSLAIT